MDIVRSYFFLIATLTSWTFLDHFCHLFWVGFGVALLLQPPKSDDKNGQEMFNWSELHSEKSNFLQNPYFSPIFFKEFFWKDLTNFQHWKMTLKIRIFRCLRRLFIILVNLTVTLFSEKMLISTRCIHGFMSNSIKKSWKGSTQKCCSLINTGNK